MSRKSWAARALILLVGLTLCYLTAVRGFAAAISDRQPQHALKFAPAQPEALAATAFRLLQTDRSPIAVERAEALAKRALQREPVNVVALRSLGLAAALGGRNEQARAYFTLVERQSRRDLVSQLWWIEYRVTRGDVAGALTYYDEALRTSNRAAGLLMPILTQAVTDPAIADALMPFLKRRPTYFRQFFIQASDTTPDMAAVAGIGRKLLDRGNPDDQDLINRIILRFGRDGKYNDAWQTFTWAYGGSPGSIVNGSFDRPSPFRLFNWNPAESDALTTEIVPRDGTNSLYLIARVSRGIATRQLLRLAPGRYRLDAVVGDVPDAPSDRPTIGITCADADGTLLMPVPFPASPNPGTPIREGFDVKAGCRYQWLNLTASASSEDETRAWIDDVSIRPNR